LKPRSNSLTRDNIYKLSKRIELIGVSFLNDIIAASEAETNSAQIFDDIIAQIFFFINTVGADKIALSPDYIDTEYFSRRFNTELVFPDILMTQRGLLLLTERMSTSLSLNGVKNITSGNVERLLQS
jgi:microsomal dipeptidase-like Zn-dependent dipeptidase